MSLLGGVSDGLVKRMGILAKTILRRANQLEENPGECLEIGLSPPFSSKNPALVEGNPPPLEGQGREQTAMVEISSPTNSEGGRNPDS